MARTPAGAALTESFLRLTRAVSADVLAQLLRLWPGVDPQRPATFELFNNAASLLVLDGFRRSAGLAAAYYSGFRMIEGIGGEARTPIAPTPARDRVDGLLRGAAVIGILRARDAGFSIAAERNQGWVQLAGQATSLVVGGARQTVLASVDADREANAYQRVTASPCGYCAMLASRGPVYSSEFEAHDHCQCTLEPVYPGSAMPPRSAEYRALWDSTTQGLSGSDAINAFRREVEAPASIADEEAA